MAAVTGVAVWTHNFGTWVENTASGPTKGPIYVNAGDTNVTALDFDTGAQLWTYFAPVDSEDSLLANYVGPIVRGSPGPLHVYVCLVRLPVACQAAPPPRSLPLAVAAE